MEKNYSVKINEIVFLIEEQAYDMLNNYMSQLKNYFKREQNPEEIMMDIESRISELFSARLNSGHKVIEVEDVEYVIDTMGRVEDIDNSFQQEDNFKSEIDENIPKRFFRDRDHRMLGGVCSGLSNYFDVDITIVRIIFIALLFLWSASFWIYLILWIIVPEAKTSAQRLEMKGKNPSIENIKDEINRSGRNLSDTVKSTVDSNFISKPTLLDRLMDGIIILGRALLGIMGIFLSVSTIALAVLIILVSFSILPIPVANFVLFNDLFFAVPGLIGLSGLIAIIPMIFVSYVFISVAFFKKIKIGLIWKTTGIIWLVLTATIIILWIFIGFNNYQI